MSSGTEHRTSHGKHFYRSVVDGVGMANEYLASRLGMAEYARHKGISYAMVKYWVKRARELSHAAAVSPASRASSGSSDGGLIEVASVSAFGEVGPPTTAVAKPVEPIRGTRAVSALVPPPLIEERLESGVRIAVGADFSPEVLRAVVSCLTERDRSC